MNTVENIKLKIDEFNQSKHVFLDDLKQDFYHALKHFFEKSNGQIKSFGWSQYTPYFNDGDECVFRTYTDYPHINGKSVDDIDELDWRIEYYLKDGRYSEQKKAEWDIELFKLIEEIKDFMSDIDDEFFKELFGDHMFITVHANGRVESEPYEHD